MAAIDHEKRRHHIGASEISGILGLNPFMTPLDIWLVKTGRKEPLEGNEHTKRGNRQEAQILDWLSEELGLQVVHNCPNIVHEGGLAAATPDGFVIDFPEKGEYLRPDPWDKRPIAEQFWEFFKVNKTAFGIDLAEAKSTLKPIYYDKGTPDFRERDITDMPNFWCQCQWQMGVTGLKKCHLAIFGPMVSNYQRFEIDFDPDFFAQALAQATEWWETHIVGDLQPDPINTSDALTLWPKDDGSTIEAVPALYEAINQYKAVAAEIKALTERKEELKDRITPAIGAAQIITFAGMKVASWKYQERAGYTVEPTSFKVLRT